MFYLSPGFFSTPNRNRPILRPERPRDKCAGMCLDHRPLARRPSRAPLPLGAQSAYNQPKPGVCRPAYPRPAVGGGPPKPLCRSVPSSRTAATAPRPTVFVPACAPREGKRCWPGGAPRAAIAWRSAQATGISDRGPNPPSAPRFPPGRRLHHPAEFRAAYRHGRRRNGPYWTLFAFRRPDSAAVSRLGLTTPRRLGVAPLRNRIRRRLRALAQAHWAELSAGWDLVIQPRSTVARASFPRLEAEWRECLRWLDRGGTATLGQNMR